MAIKSLQQVAFAQHFLKSPPLVRAMIRESTISPEDTVLDIGAGYGIITSELARISRRVIAVEKDPRLAQQLRERFRAINNIEVIEMDFLDYQISDREYKIFANIPYNITANILRRILYMPPTPREAYLILQKEAAEKFSGVPRETQFSVLVKPRFDLQIVRTLHRTDFEPAPLVDSVLLFIQKRLRPLIADAEVDRYRQFIQYGFGRWRRSLKCIFKSIFTYTQWKRLSRDLGFPLNATPTDLSFAQWLGLFDFYRRQLREGGRFERTNLN